MANAVLRIDGSYGEGAIAADRTHASAPHEDKSHADR